VLDLGVCVASQIDDVDYAKLCEDLGFAALWFADSQMIWSDVFATMALAADRTSHIRIGTGVAVAGTRPAPVLAAGMATINRIAPDRVFCGVGSGNTAMRIMGHKPVTIAELDEYLRVLRPLLRGEEVSLAYRGKQARTKHLMPDAGFVDFEHEIPLHVSGFGPRSIALAGKHGDGLVLGGSLTPQTVAALKGLTGRADEGFEITALTTMVVLEPGEDAGSERVKAEAGSMAISGLHYAYEQVVQLGNPPPAYAAPFWDEYVAQVEAVPLERRHLHVHRGHCCWVEPDEERFVTREMIEATCMIGTADELAARCRALSDAGLTQLMLLPPLACKEKVLGDVAEHVMPRL
jgi:alkanesulfonate monooxygenase SsuD/methylene tetrahydromethanopterin reductase-like flavin-dependent oxidoreductase (luciferase family)